MKSRILAVAALVSVLSFMPAHAQEAGGFGKDIPLEFAVRQIVPQGTSVQLGEGVDGKVKVSWDGSGGWQKALGQAVAGAGYVMSVAGDKITISRAGATVEVAEVTAKPAAAPQKPAEEPKPAAPRRTPRPAAEPAPRVVEMPVVSGGGFVLIPEVASAGNGGRGDGWTEYEAQQPTITEWVVQPGDDLNVILAGWAEKEGWRIVWESEYIYKLTSAAKFRGDFTTATTELLRSMQDARPVITAQFHLGNKVLVIGNNNLDEAN